MENSKDDEFLGAEAVDPYSLTKYMQRDADNNLIATMETKSPGALLIDLAHAVRLKHKIEIGDLEEYGVKLLENRGNIAKTARWFNLAVTEFRMLIRTEPVLNAYWRACYHEIKALVDDRVLEIIEENKPENKDILKEVFKKMYAGRKQGGYNINELGAIGYSDPLAVEQQEHIKAEMNEGDGNTFNVIIEFADKTVPLNSTESVEGQLLGSIDVDAIDADEEN